MGRYYDADACETMQDEDAEPCTRPIDNASVFEGKLSLCGTPAAIAAKFATVAGNKRIKCMIEWSEEGEDFPW